MCPTGATAGQGKRVRGKPFLELAYGYMPLVWAGTLAHYLLPFLSEAGRILPVGNSSTQSLVRPVISCTDRDL